MQRNTWGCQQASTPYWMQSGLSALMRILFGVMLLVWSFSISKSGLCSWCGWRSSRTAAASDFCPALWVSSNSTNWKFDSSISPPCDRQIANARPSYESVKFFCVFECILVLRLEARKFVSDTFVANTCISSCISSFIGDFLMENTSSKSLTYHIVSIFFWFYSWKDLQLWWHKTRSLQVNLKSLILTYFPPVWALAFLRWAPWS